MNEFNLVNKQKRLRYVTVYDKLFSMINEGVFPKGSRLPSEPELAKSIGVSRTTLRQALSLLQDDGLIKNIQGKGNFIMNTSSVKNTGLETLSNPIYKCITEKIDDIEMDFHIEIPNDYMNKTLGKNTAICILVDRWYKCNNDVIAYCFSLIPIETISNFNIDLNDKDKLLKFIENDIYDKSTNGLTELRLSASSSFSAKKYSLTPKEPCSLLQESLFINSDKNPIIFNKFYIPMNISSIKINSSSL